MTRVALVQLQYNPKTLWFDPQDLQLEDGDKVIVKTERGTEYGLCSGTADVDESAIDELKTPLKPVLRIATSDDLATVEEMRQKSTEALPIFKRMAAESGLDMRPIMVEYLFDGEKAVFFFEAEQRIDFRELVRKLASEFKVRVDMRQIGVRDEARMVGGLGHCGQELCCKRLGGEFCPVSIRMAKEQDLSLNPTKISGVCGRLMCCLRYEFDAYKDFHSRAPKQGGKVSTPQGIAKVVDLDVPREMITVKLEDDDKRITFPLAAMDEAEEGARPHSIGDVFEEYANPDPFAGTAIVGMFDTASFTGEDKLGTPEAHHNPSRVDDDTTKKKSRRRRRRKDSQDNAQRSSSQQTSTQGETRQGAAKQGVLKQSESKQPSGQAGVSSTSRRSRRRSTKMNAGGIQTTSTQAAQSQSTRTEAVGGQTSGSQTARPQASSGPRPGQKSSSLSSKNARSESRSSGQQPSGSTHRTSRRRSHKTGSDHES